MYHKFLPQRQAHFFGQKSRHKLDISLCRPNALLQLPAAVFRSVTCLDDGNHVLAPVPNSGLNLAETVKNVASAAGEPEGFAHTLGQERFDPLDQIRWNFDRLLRRLGEQVPLDRRCERFAIGADPNSTARQSCP